MMQSTFELKVGTYRYFKDIEADHLDPASLLKVNIQTDYKGNLRQFVSANRCEADCAIFFYFVHPLLFDIIFIVLTFMTLNE